jgi:hypothetical protein
MDKYIHHVSGIFSHRDAATSAVSILIDKGIPKNRLQLFDSDSTLPPSSQQAKSNSVLKDMVVDGAIGTAVGTGIGALAEVALVAANVTLFVASPLIAPLALLGSGASLGATIGATVGAKVSPDKKEGWLSDLIKGAISNGQFVLVAQTLTPQETEVAQEVIKLSVDNYKNISVT